MNMVNSSSSGGSDGDNSGGCDRLNRSSSNMNNGKYKVQAFLIGDDSADTSSLL